MYSEEGESHAGSMQTIYTDSKVDEVMHRDTWNMVFIVTQTISEIRPYTPCRIPCLKVRLRARNHFM